MNKRDARLGSARLRARMAMVRLRQEAAKVVGAAPGRAHSPCGIGLEWIFQELCARDGGAKPSEVERLTYAFQAVAQLADVVALATHAAPEQADPDDAPLPSAEQKTAVH